MHFSDCEWDIRVIMCTFQTESGEVSLSTGKVIYELFEPEPKILGIFRPFWPKNQVFAPQLVQFRPIVNELKIRLCV